MKSQISKKGIHVSSKAIYISAIVMSLLAIFPLGYEFYMVLRSVLCIAGCFAGYQLFLLGQTTWILFALIALLFNPLVPVHFESRLPWFFLNVLSALAFSWLLRSLNGEDD